jgi:predicted nucleotidyltransferase
MRREDLIKRLNELRPVLDSHGVLRLRVFGSHARDQARADSDVDLIADFDGPVSLLDIIALEQELSVKLGLPVELTTSGGIKPRFRERIDAEAIDA